MKKKCLHTFFSFSHNYKLILTRLVTAYILFCIALSRRRGSLRFTNRKKRACVAPFKIDAFFISRSLHGVSRWAWLPIVWTQVAVCRCILRRRVDFVCKLPSRSSAVQANVNYYRQARTRALRLCRDLTLSSMYWAFTLIKREKNLNLPRDIYIRTYVTIGMLKIKSIE